MEKSVTKAEWITKIMYRACGFLLRLANLYLCCTGFMTLILISYKRYLMPEVDIMTTCQFFEPILVVYIFFEGFRALIKIFRDKSKKQWEGSVVSTGIIICTSFSYTVVNLINGVNLRLLIALYLGICGIRWSLCIYAKYRHYAL